MADDTAKTAGPFDVKIVRSLVALMSQHELSEIDLKDGEQRIRLRRGGNHGEVVIPASPSWTPAAPPSPPRAATEWNDSASESAPSKKYHEIKSPTPGTYYSKPKPDAEPFVKVGDRVTASTVVCLIEAMKIFNEIQAECEGVVQEIVVENENAVEYGQVLIRVDTGA